MNKKLQVFVSSTYTDLEEERQAAVQAILDAGHIPAGMELFKAGNESQLKTIYKWIDESDVYMLILGGRYGSIEEKSGKSYTQLEYEYALSKDIPVFAVVLSESFLTTKINLFGLSNIMEQKAPDKYQTFKSLVMSKIIRMVDDCKDIKLAVHSTLNEFVNECNLIGWVRNYTNNNSVILLNENNSLKMQIQQLQKQLDNIKEKTDSNLSFTTLITILKNSSFENNEKKQISAFEFFYKHYSNCLQKYCATNNTACSIFFFLEKLNLVKKIEPSDSKDIFIFILTHYGFDLSKYIQEHKSQILH